MTVKAAQHPERMLDEVNAVPAETAVILIGSQIRLRRGLGPLPQQRGQRTELLRPASSADFSSGVPSSAPHNAQTSTVPTFVQPSIFALDFTTLFSPQCGHVIVSP